MSKITQQPVRVRTSEGEASFQHISKSKGRIIATAYGNDLPNRWITFPEGTKFELCANFEKTDTYMLAVTTKLDDEKEETTRGVILRRMSYQKLLAAQQPAAKPSVSEEPTKVTEAGADELSKFLTPEVQSEDAVQAESEDTHAEKVAA